MYKITLLAMLAIIAGCKKDEPKPSAGKGGNATLKVSPNHHGRTIYGTKVYIKYNATNTPSSYDDSVATVDENGKAVANFSGLMPGNYYLFGKGYDSSVFAPVIGGIPYTITDERTYTIDLPVTEGD